MEKELKKVYMEIEMSEDVMNLLLYVANHKKINPGNIIEACLTSNYTLDMCSS